MENLANNGPGISSELVALIEPIQSSGVMLSTLATSLSAAVSGGMSAQIGNVPTNEQVPTDSAAEKGGQSSASPFSGLFEALNEQFSGIITKTFGGGEGGEGLFGTIGSLFGGKQGDGEDPAPEVMGAEEGAEKVKGADDGIAKDKAKSDAERVKSDGDTWKTIVANAISGSKKLRKIQKAAAIGSVVISTATGIAKAFADNGFPGGIIPAAKVALNGATQLKAIKGQAHDGIDNIPSTGTYLLERGERVVDSRLNTDLSGFLKTQNAVANNNHNQTSNQTDNRSVTNAPVINVTVGADADESTIASNRGTMETMIREIFADYAMDAPFD